ncbi:MAG: hypothetical protein QXE07_06070 [Thermoplasmata archaeon]
MELNVGYTKYNIEESKLIFSFGSLIDYSPNSSQIEDAIGDHYYLYKTKADTYFIYYKIIGQNGFMEPGYIAAEGILPIPKDLAILIQDRDTTPQQGEPVENQRNEKFEDIIADLFQWHENVRNLVKDRFSNPEDLINDLKEMLICLNASSYRGCLALAGVSLERLLKEFLTKNQIHFEKDWMVGRLIAEIEKSGKYVDPSLKNIWNIINAQRIIGVHAKERTPIPSKDQAMMVVYAIKDTTNRMLNE